MTGHVLIGEYVPALRAAAAGSSASWRPIAAPVRQLGQAGAQAAEVAPGPGVAASRCRPRKSSAERPSSSAAGRRPRRAPVPLRPARASTTALRPVLQRRPALALFAASRVKHTPFPAVS